MQAYKAAGQLQGQEEGCGRPGDAQPYEEGDQGSGRGEGVREVKVGEDPGRVLCSQLPGRAVWGLGGTPGGLWRPHVGAWGTQGLSGPCYQERPLTP